MVYTFSMSLFYLPQSDSFGVGINFLTSCDEYCAVTKKKEMEDSRMTHSTVESLNAWVTET